MNITSLMVTTALLGIITPGVVQVSLYPMVAQKRATNFGIAESAAVSFASAAEQATTMPPTPDSCDDPVLTGDDSYEITCFEGSDPYQMSAMRAFRLAANNTSPSGLGVYSDDDLDGFDDITGLPTHYWECYSGWKGVGSVKNNCDLGGSYVIPAYAHLYPNKDES